jgi:hypothetical protein
VCDWPHVKSHYDFDSSVRSLTATYKLCMLSIYVNVRTRPDFQCHEFPTGPKETEYSVWHCDEDTQTRRLNFVEEGAFKNKWRFTVIQTNKLRSQNKFTARLFWHLCFNWMYNLGLLCHHLSTFHQYYVFTIQRKTENYSLFIDILPTPYSLSNWQRLYIKNTSLSVSLSLSLPPPPNRRKWREQQ